MKDDLGISEAELMSGISLADIIAHKHIFNRAVGLIDQGKTNEAKALLATSPVYEKMAQNMTAKLDERKQAQLIAARP